MVKSEAERKLEKAGNEDAPGRWEHLVEVAFRLTEGLDELDLHATDEQRDAVARRILLCLDALDELLEVFPGDIDPVDDLSGYGVRRLVATMRRALLGLSSGDREP